MKNSTSINQLYEWRHFDASPEESELELLNDYYECLIECDDTNQASCKKICREVLM
jgi:uncharacterized protein Usg